MNQFLITDGIILRRIKRLQHRRQVLPLVLFGIFLWLSLMLPTPYIFHILSILSLLWYFAIAAAFRLRQKIALPDPNSIYSPISGKVTGIKEDGNSYLVSIRKKYRDLVELRCPKTGFAWEGDELVLSHPQIRINFRARSVFHVPESKMQTSEVIAYIPGKALCTIRIPRSIPLALREGNICDAGDSRITLPDFTMDSHT